MNTFSRDDSHEETESTVGKELTDECWVVAQLDQLSWFEQLTEHCEAGHCLPVQGNAITFPAAEISSDNFPHKVRES